NRVRLAIHEVHHYRCAGSGQDRSLEVVASCLRPVGDLVAVGVSEVVGEGDLIFIRTRASAALDHFAGHSTPVARQAAQGPELSNVPACQPEHAGQGHEDEYPEDQLDFSRPLALPFHKPLLEPADGWIPGVVADLDAASLR